MRYPPRPTDGVAPWPKRIERPPFDETDTTYPPNQRRRREFTAEERASNIAWWQRAHDAATEWERRGLKSPYNHCIADAQIETLEQLRRLSRKELLRIEGVGTKGVHVIEAFIKYHEIKAGVNDSMIRKAPSLAQLPARDLPIRDVFALVAMHALISNPFYDGWSEESFANKAYDHADAMLAARSTEEEK